jgi:hypothetical protein
LSEFGDFERQALSLEEGDGLVFRVEDEMIPDPRFGSAAVVGAYWTPDIGALAEALADYRQDCAGLRARSELGVEVQPARGHQWRATIGELIGEEVSLRLRFTSVRTTFGNPPVTR